MTSFMIEYDTGSTATWSNVQSWEVQDQILAVTFEPGILDRFTRPGPAMAKRTPASYA